MDNIEIPDFVKKNPVVNYATNNPLTVISSGLIVDFVGGFVQYLLRYRQYINILMMQRGRNAVIAQGFPGNGNRINRIL